jgi:hypothetical protein
MKTWDKVSLVRAHRELKYRRNDLVLDNIGLKLL